MFYRFVTEVPLRWVDVDSAGVINNAVYLSIMEQARYAYLSHLDLLTGRHIDFVLAETSMKFLRPGRLGMKVEAAVCTTKLGSTSFHMNYEIRAQDNVLCKASAALVFVDSDMMPCALPDRFRREVSQFEQLDS